MKALSIRAPWWWFILNAGKDIENRDWPTGLRGTVYVHASKWWGVRDVEDDLDYAIGCWETQYKAVATVGLTDPEVEADALRKMRALGGHIVGTVEIVGCVTESESPWFNGKFGFVLRNPRPIGKPFAVKGALGFFDVAEPKSTKGV